MTFTFYILNFNCYAQPSQHIRVAILQDETSVRIKVGGSYRIFDLSSNRVLLHGRNLNTTVTINERGISLGNIKSQTDKVFIQSDVADAVIINGRRFKGAVQLIKKDNLRFSVINYIDLEDYIKGILYHETSHYWPQETLKAQAIICRTYAAYQMQENIFKDYDVTSDIYSQVYGGSTSERYRTNKAVDETKGKILIYQNKIFPAYYHATCGGHTERASLLWSIDILPLKGVPCNFCQDSPHFRWYRVLSQSQIKDALLKSGYDAYDKIKDIIIMGRDKSGRVTELQIITDKKDIRIYAKDFRNTIGPNIIRSTNFMVFVVNRDVVFEGYGWGHGAGLCQWGAYFMAKQGHSTEQILKYYYPGAEISLIVNR